MLFRRMLTTPSWRALISELNILQQLTMCFAFSGSTVLLHQHVVSDTFAIASLHFPTHGMFSSIPLITFRVFGVQFNVLKGFLGGSSQSYSARR